MEMSWSLAERLTRWSFAVMASVGVLVVGVHMLMSKNIQQQQQAAGIAYFKTVGMMH